MTVVSPRSTMSASHTRETRPAAARDETRASADASRVQPGVGGGGWISGGHFLGNTCPHPPRPRPPPWPVAHRQRHTASSVQGGNRADSIGIGPGDAQQPAQMNRLASKGPCHDLRVVCFSTALRRLNEQEWMLPCDSPSKSSIEKWYRRLLKMPIGYVGYVGYKHKLPYMGE